LPILSRVRSAWNAFRSTGEQQEEVYNLGLGSSSAPDRPRQRYYNDRSIITSIYTRISIDVAQVLIRHIQLDEQDRYLKNMESMLNKCFLFEPNLDQGPSQFRQDIVLTLFDKGVAAIVPVDTIGTPEAADFEIVTLRVGCVKEWFPKHVRVELYNEATGKREEVILEKKFVALVQNPFYAVMNEPLSTLSRLTRKLSLLDSVDEATGSGKLDIIIQLPYVIKSEARRQQAEQRRQDIEFQLKGSQYGIAYTDGTEKITQLNRPAENNLLKQIEYLTNLLFGQLGITEDVMNGTADEKTMLNYHNRTVKPILDVIIEAMQRSWLGIVGTANKERIRYFRDPFMFVTVGELAEIADKFSRNEIFSANEIRGFLGVPPSTDPKADQLVNSNMPQPEADVKKAS